jgi:hypothetical protein
MIVYKKNPNENEIHFVCPWQMTMSLYETKDNKEERKSLHEKLIHLMVNEWPPEDTVTDEELRMICAAKSSNEGSPNGYHKYASDSYHCPQEELCA